MHAFFGSDEAVAHAFGDDSSPEAPESIDLFDAKGRKLRPIAGRDGSVTGLAMDGEEDQSKAVRALVSERFDAVRSRLEQEVPDADAVLGHVLEGGVVFEVFAWRLADLLRPERNRHDPFEVDHRGSWWHNIMSH